MTTVATNHSYLRAELLPPQLPFDKQVIHYDLKRHPVPPLGLLVKICMSIASWLKGDPDNVAVIHCKDGRVCTMTVAACFLAWSQLFPDTGRAYAAICQIRAQSARRQHTNTVADFAIPSSHRYMKYFNSILGGLRPKGHMLILNRIIVNKLPALDSDGTTTLNVTVHKNGALLYDHELLATPAANASDSKRKAGAAIGGGGGGVEDQIGDDDENDSPLLRFKAHEGSVKYDLRVPLQGDILVEFWHLPRPAKKTGVKEVNDSDTVDVDGGASTPQPKDEKPRVVFSCAFHTGYVVNNVLSLARSEVDVRPARGSRRRRKGATTSDDTKYAPEDPRFGEDFCVDLIFSSVEGSDVRWFAALFTVCKGFYGHILF